MEQSQMLRRRTLKPIESDKEMREFDNNSLDPEIYEIQTNSRQNPKARRHTLTTWVGIDKMQTFHSQPKLPGLARQASISETNLQRSFTTLFGKSQENKGPKNYKRDSIQAVRKANHPMQIPEISVTDDAHSDSFVPSNKSRLESLRSGPRLVANAAVFVKPETPVTVVKKDNAIFSTVLDNNVDGTSPSKEPYFGPIETENKPFLPTINKTSQLVSVSAIPEVKHLRNDDAQSTPDTSRSVKRVSFDDKNILPRSNSESDIHLRPWDEQLPRLSSGASDVSVENSYHGKRRNSKFSTSSLKLHVDSHHGAAKLRYIAMLADQMAQENGLDDGDMEEGDPWHNLRKCRYLRLRHGSPDNYDTDTDLL
ncbi:hypothetical protein DPMN_131002 [Dreissena polymorpha]|uniref:Uncharacterized protein n=1 Tax=Dreissena polymorpha TaxID=45954 RepID=A0A9D4H3U6_DREPO|nr:hypothetical protein DPMN_131002 [Dreissena polymorpha]